MSVRGIRGANTVRSNTREAIIEATSQLLLRLVADNGITDADVSSALFSLTPDLNAEFPAAAARAIGWTSVPLFCVSEIDKPGALPACVRVLLHVNTAKPASEIRHVYLGGASVLRPDLVAGTTPALPELARPSIFGIAPYVPGKPIEEVQRELGLSNVIKLASNENPLGPSPLAIQALTAAAHSAHLYPDGNAFALKAAISDRLGVPLDRLIVGNGSDEIIKLLAEAFLSPGDEVVMADPTFSEYEFAAHLMGARAIKVPLAAFRHDLRAMREAVTSSTKLVFVCNPNNPSGTVVTRDELRAFLEDLPGTAIAVLDEAYYEYVDTPDYASGLELCGDSERIVVLRTFSKIYGLAGLRVGFGVASPTLIGLLGRVREPFNVNSMAQLAAAAALRDDAHLERSRKVNRDGRRFLTEGLIRIGCEVCPSEANFLFVKTRVDSKLIFRRLLRRGVIIRTGDIFGYPNFIRVTVGTQEENSRFLMAFEETLRELSREEEP